MTAVERFAPVASGLGVRFDPADAPAFVSIDPAQLESALLNLAVNAMLRRGGDRLGRRVSDARQTL